MALVNCHECDEKISDQAKACVHCGAKNPAKVNSKRLLTLLASAVSVSVLVVALGILFEAKERVRAREEIERCDQRAADVLADQTVSIVAFEVAQDACQRLRDEYVERWGPSG